MLFLDKQFCVIFFLGGRGAGRNKKTAKKTRSPRDCAYILENQKIWTKGLRPTQFPLPNYEPVHFGETSKVGLGSTKLFSSIFGPGNHSSLGETFLDSPRLPCKLWTWTGTRQVFYFNFWSWECRAHSKGFGPTKSCNPFSLRGNFFGLTKASLQIMNLFTSGKPPRLDPGPPSLSLVINHYEVPHVFPLWNGFSMKTRGHFIVTICF